MQFASRPAARLPAWQGTPYFFLSSRPPREQRIASYVIRQHRKGRMLSDVLADPYLRTCGSRRSVWKAVSQPWVLRALERNVEEAIRSLRPRGAAPRGDDAPVGAGGEAA